MSKGLQIYYDAEGKFPVNINETIKHERVIVGELTQKILYLKNESGFLITDIEMPSKLKEIKCKVPDRLRAGEITEMVMLIKPSLNKKKSITESFKINGIIDYSTGGW